MPERPPHDGSGTFSRETSILRLTAPTRVLTQRPASERRSSPVPRLPSGVVGKGRRLTVPGPRPTEADPNHKNPKKRGVAQATRCHGEAIE